MDLQLKKFDPSKIGDDKVVCIVSKGGGGKTTLATDIMYHKRHIPSGIVMSGTEGSNRHWQQFVPSLFVYESFNKPALRALLENQKRLCKAGRGRNCFVVLDDFVYDRSVMRDPCIREIALNGRHMKIFFLFISQYSMDVTPDIRSNIDYVFALRENNIMNRERLYRNYFGVIPTFEAFCEILDQCTQNYECLVVDHTSDSNRIEDVIFWYKADADLMQGPGPEDPAAAMAGGDIRQVQIARQALVRKPSPVTQDDQYTSDDIGGVTVEDDALVAQNPAPHEY
eukprot:jgi/Mesvir1/18153/Mv09451-RA.1